MSADHYEKIWQRDEMGQEIDDEVEQPQAVLQRGVDVISKLETQYCDQVILLISHGDMLQILRTLVTGILPHKHRSLTHHETAEIKYLVSQDQ
jgi:probable phosphoglycerate mutase